MKPNPLISIFRITAIYKYAFWLLFFLAIRIPVLLQGVPILTPDLRWALVSEQMYMGKFLYTQIWDDLAPLSAMVYWLVYAIGGRSFWVSHLLATVLIAVQAVMLNQIFRGRQTYNERTMIDMLLYGVLMSLFIDFYVLSAPLMANTFLILVIRYLFLHLSEKRKYNSVFEVEIGRAHV